MIDIVGAGDTNEVRIDPDIVARGLGRIVFAGQGSSVSVANGTLIDECDVHLGDGCSVDVGEGCFLRSFIVHATKAATCRIGSGVSTNARVRFLEHEPGSISVGDGSLLASDIDVTISDMHSIFDRRSGERINHARDIDIGANVWIGDRCLILKGAIIGAGSVIGAHSVVTGCIEPEALAAGVPARIVRQGIIWDRRLLDRLP